VKEIKATALAFARLRWSAVDSAHHTRGITLCVLSACGFGAMAIFAKYAYNAGFDVVSLLTVRFVLAAAVFWAIVAARRSPLPSRRVALTGLALGGAGYAAQAGLFFATLERLDASLTALLLYTYPAMVFLAALALGRERASRRRLGALALATAGTALVLLAGDVGALDGLGVAMGFTAALAYTTYILVADRAVGDADPFALSALVCTGAATTFVAVALATGGPHLQVDAGGWAAVSGVVLVSTVAAVTLFLVGLRHVGAATASIASTVEPVVTVSLAMALFGERLGVTQALGGVLVLVAVVLLQWRGGRGARVVAHDAAVEGPRPAPARTLAHEPA
jgi:drug/metabolite transporter (DMT)-like permease